MIKEIKNLAEQGLVCAITSNDEKCKEIFIKILTKIESSTEIPVSSTSQGRTYERLDDECRHNVYLVGLCFSHFEHKCLYPNLSQNAAFEIASQKLGTKKNTLKNARDWFDSKCDNHRKGWWQADLPESLKVFKEKYDKIDKDKIIAEAKSVLGIVD